VVLQRHELGEMGRADAVEIFARPVPPGDQEQFYLSEGQTRLDGEDYEEWTLFAAGAADARGRREGLDLLNGHDWIGRIKIQRMYQMRSGPFDESLHVVGDRAGWRIVNVLENDVEHRSGELA
jgi:hypothetical protein